MGRDNLLISVFVVLATGIAAGTLFYLVTILQRHWNQSADEFRADRKPALEVMEKLSKQVDALVSIIDQLEQAQDSLAYKQRVLGDLARLTTDVAQKAPLEDSAFRALVADVVLAGTQALLPTQDNSRARFLLFNGTLIEPYASYVPDGASPFRGRTFKLGEGAVGTAFQARQAVIVADVRRDRLFKDESESPYTSVLCVPVPANSSTPIGVLNVDSPKEKQFSEDDALLLAQVANLLFVMWCLQFGLDRQLQP
ncbi:MAG TPA: GAF domain-containing protein [Symbiobacteriaceae bacterium]|nr:GAF domain-containing protein [Symbiobacteriaceae bacterium]